MACLVLNIVHDYDLFALYEDYRQHKEI